MSKCESTITVHPHARDLLFKHYRTISRIFRDVLGQLEIDYLAIALLTTKDELLFFSSNPAIEWNMIEHNLWLSDVRFQRDFFKQEQVHIWGSKHKLLGFSMGLSIPSVFDEYRVVYTYASHSDDGVTKVRIITNAAMLIRMGQFCLKNILNEIPCLKQQHHTVQQKSHLKLVINNKDYL